MNIALSTSHLLLCFCEHLSVHKNREANDMYARTTGLVLLVSIPGLLWNNIQTEMLVSYSMLSRGTLLSNHTNMI